MALRDRIKSWLGMGSEGAARGPFYGLGELWNSFLIDPHGDGWQQNLRAPLYEARHVAIVYACVQLYARALSQCTPQHLQNDGDEDWEKTTTSPAARIFRIPNSYETWAQIILNTVAEMLFCGESLWFAVYDNRFAIQSVHRLRHGQWQVYIDPESREIFYAAHLTSLDPAAPPDALIPARNVAHFRQFCPRNPLIGESPLCAAGLAAGLNVALQRSQLTFFSNAARPSGVLMTDAQLTAEQTIQLRNRFAEQAKDMAQGGNPVLTHGLKYEPLGVAANDAQLIEQQKMSALDVARVYGVPTALISDATGPQGGTEALIAHWLSIGLGSVIESVESTLERLFQFDASNQVELDPTPLLRVDFAARIDGLVKATQGGLLKPNEARAKEGFGPVDGGDSAYMQQQMVPLELLLQIHETKLKPPAPPPPPPADPNAPPPDPNAPPPNPTAAEPPGDPATARAYVVEMRDRKRRAAA